MAADKLRNGFAHPIILLVILIAGIIVLVMFFAFNKNHPFQSQLTVSSSPAWKTLQAKASREADIYAGKDSLPRLITGGFSGYETQKDPEQIAWAFLESNKGLYNLDTPKDVLKVDKIDQTKNSTNIHFSQYYKGIPIYGATIVIRVAPDLKVDSVASTFVSNINISIDPKTTKDQAITEVKQDVKSKVSLVIYSPVVYNNTGDPRLAWLVESDTEDDFVDALTGKLLDGYSTAPSVINREADDDNGTSSNPGTLMINESGIAPGLIFSKPDKEATNVFKFSGIVYNYYNARFNRDGWDGKGAKMIASVNYQQNPNFYYPNSNWVLNQKRTVFGFGFPDALDIVGHEWTHAVIDSTSALQYQGQSGAINEGLADIFGTFVEFYNGGSDWLFGDGAVIPGISTPLRDLKNPTKLGNPGSLNDPKYIKIQPPCTGGTKGNDFCGVHTNSSIVAKVAQLLVEGGIWNGVTVLPIGQEKTEQLFYYLMTEKLTKTSQFIDLRNEAVAAAKNGFNGSGTKYTFSDTEKGSVINAFAAVGIGSADANYDGEADDKKDPGKGIVVLTTQQSDDAIFMNGCDPNEVLVYSLPQTYGGAQIDKWEIKYQYDNAVKSASGESLDKGPWDGGGEMKDGQWYKFKLKNLPIPGTIKYKVYFSGSGVEAQSPQYQIKVNECGDKFSYKEPPQKPLLPLLAPSPTSSPTSVPSSLDSNLSDNIRQIPQPTFNPLTTLIIHTSGNLSGFVSSNGRVGPDPIVGEDSPGSRAFLTFDLSGIPAHANIDSANLSINGGIITGTPFSSLGNLSIINISFSTLDSSAYNTSGGPIASISSLSQNSFDETNLVSRLASSNSKFQIRMQFDGTGRTGNYITFPSDRMSLTVQYH